MGIVKKQGIINTIWVYVGTLVGFVSLLIIQPKFLTKEELGLTRLILSYGSVLSILFSFGISAVTVKYLPKVYGHDHKHRGFFGFLLLYTFISILVGLGILFLLKGLIFSFYKEGAKEFNDNFSYVILLTIINAFILGFNAYCIALMKTTFPTFLTDVLAKLLFITIILLHFYGYFDLKEFLLAYCLVFGIHCLLLLIHIFMIDKPGLIIDHTYINSNIGYRSILRYGVIITVTAINSVSLKYIDQMFVGRISLGDVGVYSVAAYIGLMIEIPLTALERIANSSIAHSMASQNVNEIKTVYYHSARFLLVLGGWLFLMVIANLSSLLTFLPPAFQAGQAVTIFIASGALINMATGINYPILINSDKYIWATVFMISLIVFTIVGNIIFLPVFGILGPAITACIASLMSNLLKFLFIKRTFKLQPFDMRTVYIFLMIAVLAVSAHYVQLPVSPFLSIVIKALVFSALYFGILLLSRWSSDLYKYIPAAIKSRIPLLKD